MREIRKDRKYFFNQYLSNASVALSLWRSFECERFSKEKLTHPALDIGCGDGFFARTVYKTPLEAGIDLDKRETLSAERSGSYRKVFCASAEALPFPPRHFKTVVSNCVLEHIPGVEGALKEIARVLKPGGRLLMTVPSEYFNQASFFRHLLDSLGLGLLSRWYQAGLNKIFKHYYVDPSDVWKERLKKAGFRLEKAEYIIPVPSFHTYEKWLLPALPSKISKLLFGRWVIFPRGWIKPLALHWVRKALESQDLQGVVYFLAARKKR